MRKETPPLMKNRPRVKEVVVLHKTWHHCASENFRNDCGPPVVEAALSDITSVVVGEEEVAVAQVEVD